MKINISRLCFYLAILFIINSKITKTAAGPSKETENFTAEYAEALQALWDNTERAIADLKQKPRKEQAPTVFTWNGIIKDREKMADNFLQQAIEDTKTKSPKEHAIILWDHANGSDFYKYKDFKSVPATRKNINNINIFDLSDEMLLAILNNLDPVYLIQCGRACRKLNMLQKDTLFEERIAVEKSLLKKAQE